MSNNSKQYNNIVLNDLAMYQRAEQRKQTGNHFEEDRFYDMKKREVNRELIKLQQKMKQICTTKKERYVELRFDEFTKLVVVEGV